MNAIFSLRFGHVDANLFGFLRKILNVACFTKRTRVLYYNSKSPLAKTHSCPPHICPYASQPDLSPTDAPELAKRKSGVCDSLLASFNNQAGTNSAIFSMLTGLIPLHFDDCLPFSMFTIADISKINSADFNQTLEKFNQKCFV